MPWQGWRWRGRWPPLPGRLLFFLSETPGREHPKIAPWPCNTPPGTSLPGVSAPSAALIPLHIVPAALTPFLLPTGAFLPLISIVWNFFFPPEWLIWGGAEQVTHNPQGSECRGGLKTS